MGKFLKSFFIYLFIAVVILYGSAWIIEAFTKSQRPTGTKANILYSGTCVCVNGDGYTSDKRYHCAEGNTSFRPLNCASSMYCGTNCTALPQNIKQEKTMQNQEPSSKNVNSPILQSMILTAATPASGTQFSVPDITDTVNILNDGIKRVVLFKLIDVLEAYWIDTQRFPYGSIADNKSWIQTLTDMGDLNPTYKTVLFTYFQQQNDMCGTPYQKGFCYISDGKNATLFVQLLSHMEKSVCDGNPTFFYWSSNGDLGTVCNLVPL